MRYEVGICNEGVKEYELFFKTYRHADIAIYVAKNDKEKYNDIYKIDYIEHGHDDHRVYVVCDNGVLHVLLEKINYELRYFCDAGETVEWEWL